MSKKDPYYTYTDYWPVPRARPSKLGWVLLVIGLSVLLGTLGGLMIYNSMLGG